MGGFINGDGRRPGFVGPKPVTSRSRTIRPSLIAEARLIEAADALAATAVASDAITLTDEASATVLQLPSLTLTAVLDFGGNTDDGRLVEAVALPWFAILQMLQADPDRMHEIDPRTWEEIIAGAYKADGWDEVVLTPRSGDHGRDVIAVKKGFGAVKFLDQVKAYKPGHIVTADEVRAMAGVLAGFNDATKGIVTTTSEFAPRIEQDEGLKRLLPYRIELRPRGVLLPWLERLAKRRA